MKAKMQANQPLTRKYSRVLVAGGTGFIGSHIVDKLLKTDAKMTVLDILFTGRRENIKQHKQNRNSSFVKRDVRNLKLAKKTGKESTPSSTESAKG